MKNKLLLIITAIGFCFPKITIGQVPPNLGVVNQFVIFSSNGAVTHTGAGINSHITGDVGSEIGGNSGFGNVDGVMRAGGLVTAAALADLNLVYLDLNTQGPLTAHVPLLGGETLPPGLYTIPVPATPSLNGVLTLDGGGNQNAYFFFKLGTDFSTGPNSEVKLINGAKACNVFWLVDGVVSIAAGTKMKGNIIAHTGAINIASGVTLDGRALSTGGAISVSVGLNATKPIGCGSTLLTGPLSPPLGSTSCFAIFSSDGPVSDDFASFVTGDVGTNLGSTNGYDPLHVVGAIHPIPDIPTNSAATDVGPAYNFLNLLPHDIELLYPANLGFGLVLTPHTYILNTATHLTDTLFLDAQGNINAVFVIKINAAFTTATYSVVAFRNGAQAKNVFWKIDGSVEINDYSVFKGTIISAGAITLKTGVKIEGRVLTSVGAINTFATQVNIPVGTCGPPCINANITLEPTNKTICIGDSTALVVNAVGTGLTYQWRKGNVNLINGSGISGVTNDTLVFNPTTALNNANDYNVIVTGTCGKDTSINVSLNVQTKTLITLEPINKTVCAGDSTAFVVNATGANLTYQWRKGNVNLVNGPGISGVTNDTLVFNPASALNNRNDYNVIVIGSCGRDTSINVTLNVQAKTLITLEPTNKTICIGDSTALVVNAVGTGLTYQWRKGNVNLINGSGISGVTNDTLVFNPTTALNNANDYNVIVTGTCGKDTSINVTLNVQPKTLITTEPINNSICVGSSASFTVVAAGVGLTYQWRKGNVNVTNGSGISGATTATLTFNSATALQSANNYNVIVIGTCGRDTSANVSLVVNSSVAIVTQPVNKTVCAGGAVYFSVVATGADLTYQWRKGTVNLVNGGNISGVTTDTLKINPASLADASTVYNVVVTGGCFPSGSTLVDLKSAGNFGILSGVGISSTGFSVISNMNVGISPGVRSQITGFPPATVVNGSIFASDDIAPPGVPAMLLQAKLDLTNAYLFAEGATAPAPVTVAGDQGGVTLAPGIYKSTSTLLIQAGDLTLDAQGNANAAWIFQVASDFTTIGGAGGNVILAGGAQAKNVTWQVGSSATIGNGTSFKGNILALSSITMNTGSSIEGRLLARNGSVVLSGTNLINLPLNSATTGNSNLTSVNVSLIVNPKTIITVEPINKTVCVGDSTGFNVVASGTALTYQWRKGNVNVTNGSGISGATTATLSFNPSNVLHAATNYNVIVTGTCGKDTSVNVALVVNPKTIITIEPINKTVCLGDSTGFNVVATGTNLTYQWRKGNVNVTNGSGISGATTATLSFNPSNALHAATNYNVIVTGTCGKDTSVNVALVVNPNTVITLQPINKTICAGDSTGFSVTATGTNLTYQWRKGNVNVTNGSGISGATTATLSFNPSNALHAATNYNVIVTGTCGNVTSVNVALVVNPIAVITLQPINKTICAGDSTGFSVTATGMNLTYQWRKGNVNVTNGAGISGATTATLSFEPTSALHAGTDYNVVVTGTCGNVTSVNVSLVVNPITVITIQPINKTVCEGASADFTVTSTGTALTYQWRKGSVNLTNGAGISGATSATLTFNPTSALEAGTDYNVVVTGTCGNVTSVNVSLIVNAIPVAVISSNTPVCISDEVQLTAGTISGGTYAWSGVNGFTSTLQNPTIPNATLANAGVYSLTVTANGCSSTTVQTTVVIKNCGTDLSILKTVSNTTPIIGKTVVFTIVVKNNGPIDAVGVVVNDLLPTGYTYVSSTVSVGSFNATTGDWTIGSMLNGATETMTVTVTVNKTGDYLNTATVSANYLDLDLSNNSSSVVTFPTDFFIPEGFSPNGDGINDLFVIRGILNYPENTITIFNRWGNKVYDASPYQNTWSGNTTSGISVGGDELPTGTYFYVLDLNDGSKVYKGTIYLNR